MMNKMNLSTKCYGQAWSTSRWTAFLSLSVCLILALGCQSAGQGNRYEGMTDMERSYAKSKLESLSHDMTRREVVSQLGIPKHEYVRESGAMLEWYGPNQNPTSRIAVYFDNNAHPVQVRWMARNRFVWQHDLKDKGDHEQVEAGSQKPVAP